MTIKEMHYDFKKKLNKIDSQQYRNLLIPEIDWTLNEAQELFVKLIANPRQRSYLGFEINQRTIDDIRTLVVRPESDPNASIQIQNNIVTLPSDYWHFIKAEVTISKNSCGDRIARFYPQQHDDEFEESSFNQSSYEWKSVNGTFFEEGIKLYDDGTFINKIFNLVYLKRPSYIHNAEDFRQGTYTLPSGIELTGSVNSELPESTHREIVDIAVLIASGEINTPDYQLKLQKLNLNKLN